MPRIRTAALLAVTSVVAVTPVHAAAMDWSCYARFARVLEQRGFPGADCATAKVSIRFLGSVAQAKDRYLVYQYGYVDDPAKLHGAQPHALKRILIFKNGITDYLGNYVMDAGFKAKVQGSRIRVLTETPDENGTIEIGPAGPPAKALYGGEEQSFDR